MGQILFIKVLRNSWSFKDVILDESIENYIALKNALWGTFINARDANYDTGIGREQLFENKILKSLLVLTMLKNIPSSKDYIINVFKLKEQTKIIDYKAELDNLGLTAERLDEFYVEFFDLFNKEEILDKAECCNICRQHLGMGKIDYHRNLLKNFIIAISAKNTGDSSPKLRFTNQFLYNGYKMNDDLLYGC